MTTIILAISALLSLTAFSNPVLFDKLKFSPTMVKHQKQWYRFVTHSFIHADFTHLFINMFVLFQFGKYVESIYDFHFGSLGGVLFLLMYFGGVIAASVPAYRKHQENPYYNAVGASGGVAAVLFALVLLRPTQIFYVFLFIPMPAFVFGILYLWYEKRMEMKGQGNIAHDAHYTGAIFGFVFTALLNINFITDFFSQIFNLLP